MTTIACVQLLALAVVDPADARPRARHRFHVMTPALYDRLSPEARANTDRVASYVSDRNGRRGTAFLVTGADARGYALAMTNNHVIKGDRVDRAQLRFMPRGSTGKQGINAPVTGVVARSRWLDYALIRVRLPESLRGLAPVQIETGRSRGDRAPVYSVGCPSLRRLILSRAPGKVWSKIGLAADRRLYRGHVTIAFQPRLSLLHRIPGLVPLVNKISPRAMWRRIRIKDRHSYLDELHVRGIKTIQSGRTGGLLGRLAIRLAWLEKATGGAIQTYQLPNRGGSSGSPIFSARSHRVVSLLFGGRGRWADGQEMHRILADLSRKLQRGRISPAHHQAVQGILASD
jgi:hypothetical protein